MKVRFLKSPTGRFALGYHAGEVGEIPASLVDQAIKEGYIEKVSEPEVERAIAPQVQQAQQRPGQPQKQGKKWGAGK